MVCSIVSDKSRCIILQPIFIAEKAEICCRKMSGDSGVASSFDFSFTCAVIVHDSEGLFKQSVNVDL